MKKLILLILLIAGCQSSPENIPFTTVKRDSHFSNEFTKSGRDLLIQDQTTWMKIWNSLHWDFEEVPLPPVDFDKYRMVVTIAKARAGGYTTEIRRVLVTGRRLVITIHSGPPNSPLLSQAITQPWHIVQIPRLETGLIPEWLHLRFDHDD